MFELKVIKKFIGKEEGKTLSPGDKVKTADIARVNALVGRGYCEITSVVLESEDKPEDKPKKKSEDKPEDKKGKEEEKDK